MKIVIDEHAGVCSGVSRALRLAEEALPKGKPLVSVGPLIHNQVEIERLAALGLETAEQEQFEEGETWKESCAGAALLIRAHGISAKLRTKFDQSGFEIIDGTCPIVRKSLEEIESFTDQDYQIIIVGKKNHPEVKAMTGSAKNGVMVISSKEEAARLLLQPKSLVIAQTTASPENYFEIVNYLRELNSEIVVKNSICKAVSQRHEHLKKFAREHEVIIFVGGKHSSNTKELFEICRRENPNSYLVERFSGIELQWFLDTRSIGISGSASTPWQQLEDIQSQLLAATALPK